jgi:hypothetical protein
MAAKQKPIKPTGMKLVDALSSIDRPTLQDYVNAASEYVIACENLQELKLRDGTRVTKGARKKAGQIRLSSALGRALAMDLHEKLPRIDAVAGETKVSGALRVAKMDVVEMNQLDGLKLAIELKPVNLAVGRAIWNRYGDIRVGAVSTHLKFPYAVVGGVLTFPTWESTASGRKSTTHLIGRCCELLSRAGNRRREDDAPHRLEGVAVVAFDPSTRKIEQQLPAPGSGLRWEECVAGLAEAYDLRFAPDEALIASEESDEDDA